MSRSEEEKLASLKGRKTKSKGDVGELIAKRALIDLGYNFVRKIHTPWRIIREKYPRPGTKKRRVIDAHAETKVAGDWRAVEEGGRSVLAEVKNYDKPTLIYSALEPNQHRSLQEHYEAGGLSLIVWVHERTPYVLAYPVPGFKPRSSIKLIDAQRWSILQHD